MKRILRFPILLFATLLPVPLAAQDGFGASPPTRDGAGQTEALRSNDVIFQATGFGNTLMVVTPAGNVIIDTSLAATAPRHKRLLQAVDDGPIRYIILTHGHGDHTGGVSLWEEPGTEIVAQENHVEFINYPRRLASLFGNRATQQQLEVSR